ncbi:outer membrane protein assembly factor BamC [Alteromonas aestuariivivens]|uniref:Outer membrane protein assembly factor BamC n=1 Tax=Alteromonas aestuariivivens TaxID=1938339 RepID=A0A3D8MAS4_9ALTE|nr:outer membrane protein assembly factor BamC [Alteromonas aestuariivivens]RDV27317.1 outer membrane protein assembly factor BamC [Alteromonas aestuariivivens]
MNKSLALVSGLLVVALTGCSSQMERKTASGSYEYLKAEQQAVLKVPADLHSPDYSGDYELPQLGAGADHSLIGRELSVQSPTLVLPLVAGSRVEDGNQSATIWFDQVDDSQPLNQAIWNSLLAYLEQQGIGVESFDPEAGVLVTDWMVQDMGEDASWYDFSDETHQTERRFEFSMEVKPHGRTAALHAELKDYRETLGEDVKSDLLAMQERREEVDVLNKVINHYEYQIRLEDSRRLAQIRQGLNTELGYDSDGAAAFIVNAGYDIAWPRLLLVLRKLGFDVKDLDKSTGLLFVTYNGADESWWKGWFSDDGELLEQDDYRLRVGKMGEKTSITFMNNESKPFEPNVVADIYDAFVEAMSQDNLDI